MTVDTEVYTSLEDIPPVINSPRPTTMRRQLLEKAADTVDGGRDIEYGGPEDSFTMIAAIWSSIMGHEYDAGDVAMMMAGLKLARLAGTRGLHMDSWVDLAGYAACGYEVVNKSLD
jgi:hypothetical protein